MHASDYNNTGSHVTCGSHHCVFPCLVSPSHFCRWLCNWSIRRTLAQVELVLGLSFSIGGRRVHFICELLLLLHHFILTSNNIISTCVHFRELGGSSPECMCGRCTDVKLFPCYTYCLPLCIFSRRITMTITRRVITIRAVITITTIQITALLLHPQSPLSGERPPFT